MVLRPCDRVVAVDIAGCPVASRLRSLSIPLGDQYRCCTVIGVTLFGIIFYLFIVIAGTVSEDCTYQAPATHIFRHIVCHNLPPAVRLVPSFISSKFSCFIQVLERCKASIMWGTLDLHTLHPHCSGLRCLFSCVRGPSITGCFLQDGGSLVSSSFP